MAKRAQEVQSNLSIILGEYDYGPGIDAPARKIQHGSGYTSVYHYFAGDHEHDIAIRWDSSKNRVGLFLRNKLWAAFDGRTGAQYGGNYCSNNEPKIPPEVAGLLELLSGET